MLRGPLGHSYVYSLMGGALGRGCPQMENTVKQSLALPPMVGTFSTGEYAKTV